LLLIDVHKVSSVSARELSCLGSAQLGKFQLKLITNLFVYFQKTEAPKPHPQRKAKFGPFETSFEEIVEESPLEPKLLQSILWDPFMEPFTNNPLDYFCIMDRVPAINLSRTLRKGDILELKVLAIENPGSFYVKILGPKELLIKGQSCKSLSGFGATLSSFYNRFQDEEVLAIKEFSLERGETLLKDRSASSANRYINILIYLLNFK
jgi:hypothetical protein